MTDYYTFKICSPSRASLLTGRYPWGAGFYDMARDTEHCTYNFTALPQMLKPLGYKTHALGKWDVGFMEKNCSATERGYDTFYGYYDACQADYWYHGVSGGYPSKQAGCTNPAIPNGPVDLSNNTASRIAPAADVNGTYNRKLFSDEAVRLIHAHAQLNREEEEAYCQKSGATEQQGPVLSPFYMYLAFMNIHDGCGR